QPADLVGTPADLTLDRLSVTTSVRRGGQHRILRGDPTESRTGPPPWNSLGDTGRAQYPRSTELDKHRAGRPVLIAAGNCHIAELIIASTVFSCHPIRVGR